MRWLLLKDLQILRRSPLQAALLVLYPILIAVLVGFAISRGPEKPRVAFLNEIPKGTPFRIGGEHFDIIGARSELCARIECVRVQTRQQAIDKVKSGDVLGALILPADLIDKLQSLDIPPKDPASDSANGSPSLSELTERVIRRADELRQEWSGPRDKRRPRSQPSESLA